MSVRFTKAIVVGASSGIGEAIAVQLAQGGADVAILARRAAELERVAARVPGRLVPEPHDVAETDAVPGLFARLRERLGGLDTLVYAAGVMPALAEGEYDFGRDRQMVLVNLLGAMAWIDLAAAHFEAARGGTILGISSIAGERGRRGNPAYCATKAGLTAYLEGLRNRCTRYGVNVVTVKPGFVDTPMTRGLPGLFWVISADEAARQALALARRGRSASGYVPARWALVAAVVRAIPSAVFRHLNI